MAILPTNLARVSNLLRTNVASQQMTRTQRQLLAVQNELTTGKRINSPSDDPGDAAIVQQLRKTLERRMAYADNLKQATTHLSEVDSSLGDLTGLLQQVQTIASANVGSDVTAAERANAAAIVESLQSQMVSIANKQFEGMFIFGGDRLTTPPFVVEEGGLRFVGSTTVLDNAFDENTVRAFMVNGEEVFGALSTRVEGSADLTPALTLNTRLADLRGASGDGVRLGSIQIGNGLTTAVVDLSQADTVGDVVDAMTAAGLGSVTASITTSGLTLTGGAGEDITITEVGGGNTASDLGIFAPSGGGAGVPLVGGSVGPRVTNLTLLSDLKGGAGIDLTGLRITNAQKSTDIAFTAPPLPSPPRVQDLLNAINGSGTGVRAETNSTGTGVNILNATQGAQMSISEIGGTSATDLGVRSYGPDALVSALNFGAGVRTVASVDFTVTDSNGVAVDVDLDGTGTVQDVINAINTAAGSAGAGITASFATTGNGIVLTDTAGGGGTLTVTPQNLSAAAKDLGLLSPASGGVITGEDVHQVRSTGIFSNMRRLYDALQTSDLKALTEAAEGLKADLDRVVRLRGQTGARVQELESRQDRLDDQNLATTALLSSLEDTDFTEAITRFQTLQNSLQATMQTTARTLNLSLLDFLG